MSTERAAPQLLPGFELVRRIGEGGMGEVFEAVRIAAAGVRKPVAVKRLRLDAAYDTEARDLFFREARLAAQLDHPNVARVLDFVVENGVPFLVMELLRGQSLFALVRERGVLPAWVALEVAMQAAQGLAYVHAATGEDGKPLGIVHRDVTPSNVFVCDDGCVKLLDFGLAKASTSTSDTASVLRGTMEVVPPERWQGEPADARSDVYQAGAMLYFALVGRMPFTTGAIADVRAAIEAGIGTQLDETALGVARDVVARAMATAPNDRFADAAALLAALRDAQRNERARAPRDHGTLSQWLALRSTEVEIAPHEDFVAARIATARDGASSVPPHGLPTRYVVRGVIASGGMGVVLDAHDAMLGRDVAIKVVAPAFREDPEMRSRLLREARLAATLRHPLIVAVHDVDPEGRFIIMERMRGETLATRLARLGRLPANETRRIGRALLDALGEAHRHGVVHRDVKPSNVIFDESDAPHLADFGVAHLEDSDLTSTGVRIGTPAYMPPEQLRGGQVDARADLYALGATLFECVMGARLHHDGRRVADVDSEVFRITGDSNLATAIARAVHEDLSRRTPDAAAFLRALDDPPREDQPAVIVVPHIAAAPSVAPVANMGLPGGARAATRARHAGQRRRFGLGVALAALAAVALLAAVASWWRTVDRNVASHAAVSGVSIGTPSAHPAAPPPRASAGPFAPMTVAVALLPFDVTSGNPAARSARTSMPHLLAVELAHDVHLAVVGTYALAERAGSADAAKDQWLDAARSLGARVFVEGTLADTPDSSPARMNVRITVRGDHEAPRVLAERVVPFAEITEVVRTSAAAISLAAREIESRETARSGPGASAASAVRRGQAALEANQFHDALGAFEAARALSPRDREAAYGITLTQWWLGEPIPALQARIREAEALGVDASRIEALRALVLIDAHDYQAAVTAAARLGGHAGGEITNRYAYFETLFHAGRPDDAMAVYRDVAARDPRFRLALFHALTFYAARGDADGLGWALARAGVYGESGARVWAVRAAIARREYEAALSTAERYGEQPGDEQGNQDLLRREAIWIHLLRGRRETGASLITAAASRDEPWRTRVELAFASPTEREDAFSLALDAARTRGEPSGRAGAIAELATTFALGADAGQLAALSAALTEATRAEQAPHSAAVAGAEALIAGLRRDAPALHALANHPHEEVRAIVTAFEAELAHDARAAIAAWKRAIAASADGRFMNDEHALLARAARSAGDDALARTACEEARAPRIVSWGVPFATEACDRWVSP